MQVASSQHLVQCPPHRAHLLQAVGTPTAQVQPRGLLLQRLGQIEAQGGLHRTGMRLPRLICSQLLRQLWMGWGRACWVNKATGAAVGQPGVQVHKQVTHLQPALAALVAPVTHLSNQLQAVVLHGPVASSRALPHPVGGRAALAGGASARARALPLARTDFQLPLFNL